MLFLDAHARDLYPAWDEEAARAVASLRLVAGRYETTASWPTWSESLRSRATSSQRSGPSTPSRTACPASSASAIPSSASSRPEFEALQLPDDSGQRIMTYTAIPGSPAEAALRLLATRV